MKVTNKSCSIVGFALRLWITGIIVALNGILSTNALANPDNHITITNVSHGFPPVTLIAWQSDNSLINPACCAVPTTMNKPVKKTNVVQSTSCKTFSKGDSCYNKQDCCTSQSNHRYFQMK